MYCDVVNFQDTAPLRGAAGGVEKAWAVGDATRSSEAEPSTSGRSVVAKGSTDSAHLPIPPSPPKGGLGGGRKSA